MVLDWFEYVSTFNKTLFIEIKCYFPAFIKTCNRIKKVIISAISKNNCKDKSYFVHVKAEKEENIFWMHYNELLLKSYWKVLIQSTIVYFIKIDSLDTKTILDLSIGDILLNVPKSNGKENIIWKMGGF